MRGVRGVRGYDTEWYAAWAKERAIAYASTGISPRCNSKVHSDGNARVQGGTLGIAAERLHYENEPQRQMSTWQLSRDEAFLIAVTIAKLPSVLRQILKRYSLARPR